MLLTAHKDGRWRLWDIEDQSCKLTSNPESDWVSAIRWVPSAEGVQRVMVVAYNGPISCWEIVDGQLRRRFTVKPQDATQVPPAPPVDPWASEWAEGSWGEEPAEKPAPPPVEPAPPAPVPATNLRFASPNGTPYQCSLIVSPDGSLAAIGGQDGLSRLLDINEGTFLYCLPTKAIIRTAQFSPTRFWSCVGTDVGWLICDLESKAIVHDTQVKVRSALNTPPVPCLASAWRPDGQRFFLGYADGMVRYWDVA